MTKLPSHLSGKHLKLFARMVSMGVPQGDVMDTLDINEVEYEEILNEPRMQAAVRDAKVDAKAKAIETGDDWDSLESAAVGQLKAQLGDANLEARDILAIATAANRADRHRQDALKLARGGGQSIGGTLMNRLPTNGERTVEAEYERLTIREKEILDGVGQHVTEITSVQTVEDFMRAADPTGLPDA